MKGWFTKWTLVSLSALSLQQQHNILFVLWENYTKYMILSDGLLFHKRICEDNGRWLDAFHTGSGAVMHSGSFVEFATI